MVLLLLALYFRCTAFLSCNIFIPRLTFDWSHSSGWVYYFLGKPCTRRRPALRPVRVICDNSFPFTTTPPHSIPYRWDRSVFKIEFYVFTWTEVREQNSKMRGAHDSLLQIMMMERSLIGKIVSNTGMLTTQQKSLQKAQEKCIVSCIFCRRRLLPPVPW